MSRCVEFSLQPVAVTWEVHHGRHACRAPLWRHRTGPEHQFLGRPLAPGAAREVPPQAIRKGHLATLRQEHGTCIHRVRGTSEWSGPAGDGLSTSDPGWTLGVQTADCLPILLADPGRGVAAVLHAGWRGSAQGIVLKGIEHLRSEYGCRPTDLEAVLGPGVGGCCYEVGDEVLEAFRNGPLADVSHFRPHGAAHWIIDLAQTNARALIRAGVSPHKLQALDACTCCTNDRLHSYRAEGTSAGRNWSLLSPGHPVV